jgi:DNA adenine methylase
LTQPIIPWIGGKRRLAEQILPLFPDHQCYVEAFAGAAALFFNKEPSKAEVLNDINGELVNLYRVVKNHLEEFIRQFKWALTSRQIYKWQQMTAPETLTDIQRAARFFYLQKLAFGARVDGQSFGTSTTSGPRLNLLRIEEDLSAAYLRLAEATIENLPWPKCIERYDRPHTLFYCDPPYWETEGYGVDFPLAEYDAMAAAARSIQGTMIISVNDHPEMRRAFAGLHMRAVGITYTVGGGQNTADRQELIIGNWPDGWPAPRSLTSQVPLLDDGFNGPLRHL